MDKKVIVEKIDSQPPPVIQPQQNYTVVRQPDGQNPLFLTYSVLKPPMQRHEANVVLNVNPSSTLIVRDAPAVSNYYQVSNNVQTCIVLTPQKLQQEVGNYRTYSRTPLINTPKPAAAKRLANSFDNSKKKSFKVAETVTNAGTVQKTPSPPSTSKKPLTVSERETGTNVKPIKTPKSIKISMKNLVALDEDTKKSISATCSVANFLEKDTLEKGLEVLDSLDDTSLTLLVTKVMGTLNKIYGDYLEEQLTAHLGAEKYRRIASRGLTTFSEFLARRHAMVRRESPVKSVDDRTSVNLGKSERFVKLDAKKLLMEEMLTHTRDKPRTLDSGSKADNSFAEADKCISEKINFFRERDMPGADKSLLKKLSDRSHRENSVVNPVNLLQIDGANKNRSRINSYQQKEACKSTETVKKSARKPKNPRKHQKEDPFKFDPLLSRPSESVPENKSVILSSPDTLSSASSSLNTSSSFSGGKRKLGLCSSPASPDKNKDFPNFNIRPSNFAEGDSLSSRMSKAFKMSDSTATQKNQFEESPLKNGFPGFCAYKEQFNPKIMYLLTRLVDEGKDSKNLKKRIDEKVVGVKVEASAKEEIVIVQKASPPELVPISGVKTELAADCGGKHAESGKIEVKTEQVDCEAHLETNDIEKDYNQKKGNLEEHKTDDNYKNSISTSDVKPVMLDTTPTIKSVNIIKEASPSSSSDDISKACDSPDLQRTVKDLRELLKTFNDDAVPFVRTSSFESGISNDSFESFAQKAKDNVRIREENCGDFDWDLEADNKMKDNESKATTGSGETDCDGPVNVNLGELPGNSPLDVTSSCAQHNKKSCEKPALKTLSDDGDDDCVIVDEEVVLTNTTFTRNKNLHRLQLKNCLQRKVSSLSRIIQRRIQKVTSTFKYLSTIIEAIKGRTRNTTINVLRQKTRSLYTIGRVVDKTYLGFRKRDFMKLRSTLAKLAVQEGRDTLSSSAELGKRKRNDQTSQNKRDEMKKEGAKVDKEVQVSFQLEPLKPFNKSKQTFSKSKSDSAISLASTESTFVQSSSPNNSDAFEDIRKSMFSRGVPDDASDPGCQIVQCCFYANDKLTGGELNLDAHVKPALKQPDLAVFKMEKGRDNVNETRQVDRSKRNRGRPKKNNTNSGDNSKKKDLKVMLRKNPSDPEGIKRGRKRERSTSRKPGKSQRQKSYALRKGVREKQSDYNSDEENDVPAPVERVYPLRNRQGGNSALDVEGCGLTSHI